MRLHAKILLLLVPLVIAPMLVVSVLAYHKLEEANLRHTTARVETLLDQIEQFTRNMVDVARVNLGLLARDRLVRQYAVTEDDTLREELLASPHFLRAVPVRR